MKGTKEINYSYSLRICRSYGFVSAVSIDCNRKYCLGIILSDNTQKVELINFRIVPDLTGIDGETLDSRFDIKKSI